jgi:polyketide biosynthesis acyl carrier protein
MQRSSDWNDIFNVVVTHTREVVPHLGTHDFTPEDSLHELGANSMDRADIVMNVMETLSMSVARSALVGPTNIGELVDLIHARR